MQYLTVPKIVNEYGQAQMQVDLLMTKIRNQQTEDSEFLLRDEFAIDACRYVLQFFGLDVEEFDDFLAEEQYRIEDEYTERLYKWKCEKDD